MKKDKLKASKTELNDELRSEYDLSQLRVRRLGPERKQFGGDVVRLAPDVAAVFRDAETVNKALRLLIEVAQTSGQSQRGGV